MNTFADYHEARALAEKRAREWNTPQGIEKVNDFGRTLYKVKSLPRPENRYGVDLRCETVEVEGRYV